MLLPIISMIPEKRFDIMSFAAKLTAIPTIPRLSRVPVRLIPKNCRITINAMK